MSVTAATLAFGLAFIDHVGLSGSYTEVNPNIELSFDRFSVGAYRNSFGDPSTFISYGVYEGAVDLDLGLVLGYSDKVLPFFRLELDLDDNVSLFLLPAWNGEPGSSVGVVLGVNFKIYTLD